MTVFNGETLFRPGDIVSVHQEKDIWFRFICDWRDEEGEKINLYVVTGVQPSVITNHSQLLWIVPVNRPSAIPRSTSGYWFDPLAKLL